MEIYTIIRLFTGSVFAGTYLLCLVSGILYGIYVREHFTLFCTLFGSTMNILCGTFFSLAIFGAPFVNIHGTERITKEMSARNLWLLLFMTSSCNFLFFGIMSGIAVKYDHDDIVPLLIQSCLFGLFGLLCMYKSVTNLIPRH